MINLDKIFTAIVTDQMKDKQKTLPVGTEPSRTSSPEASTAAAYVRFICKYENLTLSPDQQQDLIDNLERSMRRAKNKAKKSASLNNLSLD